MPGQNGTRALVWIDDIDCDIAEFRRHVERKTLAHDYPSAAEISSNIPVYDGRTLDELFSSDADARTIRADRPVTIECD